MQSLLDVDNRRTALHVAIVMDGNGRWATARCLPRSAGHAAGIVALRKTAEAAPSFGIATLTVFAFSADNWRRPSAEVDDLMTLFGTYLRRDVSRLREADVRLSVIGRRDRLPSAICAAIEAAEQATVRGAELWLRVAVDYSARDAILAAAQSMQPGGLDRDTFAAALCRRAPSPDVDLMIRTGGEKRLSDFLLWECAYAELRFTDLMWPDFGAEALAESMADFHRRNRRFGGLVPATPTPARAA